MYKADSFASLSFDFFLSSGVGWFISAVLALGLKKKEGNFALFLDFWAFLGTELLYTILTPNPISR